MSAPPAYVPPGLPDAGAGALQSLLGLKAETLDDLIALVRAGFPAAVFDRLQRALDVPAHRLALLVHIPDRTLRRRRQEGRLVADESERVLRLARLYERALDVLGTPERARTWLKTPLPVLGGQTPLSFADTEPGVRAVEDVLGRIAYGVFS